MEEQASQKAEAAFSRARFKAFLRKVMAQLRGQPNTLLAFDEVRRKLRVGGLIYRGLQTVPVEKIVGSVDRYQDFDRVFLPTQDHTADRWKSISRAFYKDVALPPVKLYKIGDAYFVYDGNHRVSVAREMGVEFIDAEVTECQVRVPLSAKPLRAEDLEIKGEYAEFLERTRLDQIRPEQQIEFTIAGGYRRLLEHIAVHKYFMGLEQQREISDEEAVAHWYDHVYAPLVALIRQEKILDAFPGRTEADLYLWIMDHLHFLREQFGQEVSTKEAADHFAAHYTAKPLRRALHRVQHLVEDLVKETAREADGGVSDESTAP